MQLQSMHGLFGWKAGRPFWNCKDKANRLIILLTRSALRLITLATFYPAFLSTLLWFFSDHLLLWFFSDHLLNITTATTSSTTIQVFWNFVHNYVPKDITGYRLSYTYNMTLPGSISRTFTTIISRNLSAVTLTRLQKYTLYCFQMEYLTSDDEGGSNGCTYAKTHEDGEWLTWCFRTSPPCWI